MAVRASFCTDRVRQAANGQVTRAECSFQTTGCVPPSMTSSSNNLHSAARARPGIWSLPGKYEKLLLGQLREGAAKGWWQEFGPEEARKGMGDYLAWLYFGVEQQKNSGEWVVRGCLAPDGINAITMQPEKLYMAGVDGVAELGRALHSALSPTACLQMAREDWRSSFYQPPLHPSSSRLLCATAWDDDLGGRIFKPKRLGFGGAGAPYQFCRTKRYVYIS